MRLMCFCRGGFPASSNKHQVFARRGTVEQFGGGIVNDGPCGMEPEFATTEAKVSVHQGRGIARHRALASPAGRFAKSQTSMSAGDGPVWGWPQ